MIFDLNFGVYFLPPLQRTAIIVINQLPVNFHTLWLRLLGKGKTQNQAVRELLELPIGNNYRQNVIELLLSWRVSVEIQNILEEEDREVFMTLSQTYLEWKEGVRRQARPAGTAPVQTLPYPTENRHDAMIQWRP